MGADAKHCASGDHRVVLLDGGAVEEDGDAGDVDARARHGLHHHGPIWANLTTSKAASAAQSEKSKLMKRKLFGKKTPENEMMMAFRKTITSLERLRYLVRMSHWLLSIQPPVEATFEEFQHMTTKAKGGKNDKPFFLTERQWAQRLRFRWRTGLRTRCRC